MHPSEASFDQVSDSCRDCCQRPLGACRSHSQSSASQRGRVLHVRWISRAAALPGQASCLGLVRWRALRSVITLVANETVASIALECGGKGSFRRVASEKEAVTASSRWRLFLSFPRGGQATDSGGIAA